MISYLATNILGLEQAHGAKACGWDTSLILDE